MAFWAFIDFPGYLSSADWLISVLPSPVQAGLFEKASNLFFSFLCGLVHGLAVFLEHEILKKTMSTVML